MEKDGELVERLTGDHAIQGSTSGMAFLSLTLHRDFGRGMEDAFQTLLTICHSGRVFPGIMPRFQINLRSLHLSIYAAIMTHDS
ncbi:hypothetical protein TcasGA2_TC002685 [Tribolium castaneum]|uniref:Uncharacterized protein n=1 Tax=Tribolium castaneum TaxID=7070 RepID=D6WEA0_TRICA|nr:hypothetical protein TcasGA2_TC002685 [Tribolium castaneum]